MRLHNFSIPSIPSRYLTPVIDINVDQEVIDGIATNKNDGSMDNLVKTRVKRVENDPTIVGPGTYNTDNHNNALKKEYGSVTSWQNSRTQRVNHFVKSDNPEVGPGSYNSLQQVDRQVK